MNIRTRPATNPIPAPIAPPTGPPSCMPTIAPPAVLIPQAGPAAPLQTGSRQAGPRAKDRAAVAGHAQYGRQPVAHRRAAAKGHQASQATAHCRPPIAAMELPVSAQARQQAAPAAAAVVKRTRNPRWHAANPSLERAFPSQDPSHIGTASKTTGTDRQPDRTEKPCKFCVGDTPLKCPLGWI